MAEDIRTMKDTGNVKEFQVKYDLPDCVVLDSGYCSMGRMIAYEACKRSGYTYYDAVTLLELVPQYGLSKDQVDVYERKLRRRAYSAEELQEDEEFMRISKIFDEAADIALGKGKCLIHDRISKDQVIAKGYTCVSAMTYASDLDAKLVKARASSVYENIIDDSIIEEAIEEEDRIRKNWKRAHSKDEWGCLESYDLVLNTDTFGREYAIELLTSIMKK